MIDAHPNFTFEYEKKNKNCCVARVTDNRCNDAVGVTILKLNLTVEELHRVILVLYLNKEVHEGVYI